MTLPDSGKVEDYSEAEMNELLGKFETDKASLSKMQKAAVARYNFKKGKGEPITYRGEGAAPAADATSDKKTPAPSAGPGDIIAMLPPEVQELAGKDPASLTKEEKITLAKAKSQAVRAQAAAKKAEGGGESDKPKGPSPEELAAKKALEIPSAKRIQERFGGEQKAIAAWGMMVDTPTATVTAERILDVTRYLHIEMGFDFLQNLTAVDYPTERLEVVYNLLNMGTKEQFALKVKLPRDAPEGHDMPYLPSIVSVHKGADWLEREVFDLFGIRFTGHPYMRRIMMPDTWNGYPLRKDYDLTKEQYIGMDAAGNDVVSYKEADGW